MEEHVEMTEAHATLVRTDRTLFFQAIRYFAENGLIDDLNDYLEKAACYDIILDVTFANHIKRFLVSKRRLDATGRLLIACGCNGGGGGGVRGGSPTGVRG